MNRLQRFLAMSSALVLVLALSPVVGGNLAAQVSKGSISGSVLDPQGGAVPSAKIRIINTETNSEASGETDSNGSFRITLLPVGMYNVEISHAGFRKTLLSNVQVSVGVDRDLGSIKLELGEVTATVEVSAAPPLMTATESQVSTSIQISTIGTFPGVLENEGLDLLALTVPGVVNNRDLGFSNTNGTGFAVNGIRGRNNDQQIDGQNNNDNSVAGPGLFLSDPEFVQEYVIITNNFGAEYGRNSGSVVNIITRSGTNTWHGSVYGTESNSALNALSNTQIAFNDLKKPARYNDEFTGATIGGPWVKDHLFFFGGFNNEIISQRQVYGNGSLTPTPTGLAQLAACYPGSTSVAALRAFGPYGVGGGNPTPQSNVTTRTLVGPGGSSCTVQFAGVQRELPTGSHQYNWISKMDLQTDKNHFFGRYIYNNATFYNANSFGRAAAGYPNNVPALSQDYAFSWVRTLTSRMSNEFRASYGRLNVEFGKNSIGNTIPSQKDIGTALTNVSMPSGFVNFGPANNAPQGRIVNTYQFQDNWNYILGRHALKAGVNFTYQRSPNIFLPNLNGSFNYSSFRNPSTTSVFTTQGGCTLAVRGSPGDTVTGFSSFGCNAPNSVSVGLGNPSLDFREKDTFLYFQDDFKFKNNLTLNLGITWSYYGQPANLFHDRDTARESGSAPFFNPALPLSVRTFPELGAPKDNWGPNAGFAYTPQWGPHWLTGGKTVLRGGYRLAYDPAFYNIYLNIASSAPQVLAQTLSGATAGANPLPAVPTGPNVRTQLASFLTLGVADPRGFNQTRVTPDFKSQRTHLWSFGFQREIAPNAVFEARYAGNHAQRLFQSINFNPRVTSLVADFPSMFPGITPCPASQAVVPSATGRVRCDTGVVRQRTNTGYSDYNGLQMEFRANNLWKQLTVKTNYTFSKVTDNASEIFGSFGAGGTLAFSQNPLNFTTAEHGLSGLDIRHNWTLTFSEEIPAFRSQQGVLGKILGGWVVSGTYFMASGQPYTPSQVFLNLASGSPYNDTAFNNAFAGVSEVVRPYVGNLSAPPGSVGIFGGDVCNLFGLLCDPITGLPVPATATNIYDFAALNQGAATPTQVTANNVTVIVNGAFANQHFNTPFGNAGRNILRDAITNIGNFQLSKITKFGADGRVQVRWHVSMSNVFNHPNFSSIDPFLEDAGDVGEGDGFGIPQRFSGGVPSAVGTPGRAIRFGVRVGF